MLLLTAEAERRLVAGEALAAFARNGWRVAARPEAELAPQALARLFALSPQRSNLEEHPSLFFSVNFHGLDKHGEAFDRLNSAGVPVAVWVVDNPWNLLSGLRVDFWKKVHLFVTDPSFIPGLKTHGAHSVSFLPLATDPTIFFPRKAHFGSSPLVFVGRSAFPDKERFFVGQSVPGDMLQEALSCLRGGQRPDFFWWLEKLKLQTSATPLWPGSAARRASLGAEESSLAWRSACLREAASIGLTVYGDSGWATQFPADSTGSAPEIRPPLDYYAQLAGVYASAPFSLNMMSFLLPQGLNQRHFDVWAAGGFCLTDATLGLALFPEELAKPVTFETPEAIGGLLRRFTENPEEKAALAKGWREHILAHHTYDQRITALLAEIFS